MAVNTRVPYEEKQALPAMCLSSANEARKAQRNHRRLVWLNLLFTVISASLVVYTVEDIEMRKIITGVSLASLLTTILTFWLIRTKRYDTVWVDARKRTETIKRHAWQYMTFAEPYVNTLSPRQVDSLFSKNLVQLVGIGGSMNSDPSQEEITPYMKYVRSLNVEGRKTQYFNHRLKYQKSWYVTNARINSNKERSSLIAVVLCQIGAVLSLVMLIYFPDSLFKVSGLFTTFAASVLSWAQLKRYQELVKAYDSSAQRLNLIIAQGPHIITDDELASFVTNSELVMEEEHTLWTMRRQA